MMLNEWRYILQTNGKPAYVNGYGEVMQNDKKLLPYEDDRGNLKVDILYNAGRFDFKTETWIYVEESVFVWELMRDYWTRGWPDYGHIVFLDEDPTNCSVENIRVTYLDYKKRQEVMCGYIFEHGFLVFDKRRKGRIEITELQEVVDGIEEAAERVGGTKHGVSKVLAGRYHSHRGYTFRWV